MPTQLRLFSNYHPDIGPVPMVRHLIAAIGIVRAAEVYAARKLGRPIRFSPEDIRALAITGFIQQSRGVRRDR